MKTDKTGYVLFVMLVLSSVGFFNYHGLISIQIQKLLFYLCFGAAAGYVMCYGRSLKSIHYPRVAYAMVLIGVAFSIVPATAFHPQSLMVSVMATLPYIIAYACFWVLMRLDVTERQVLRTYMWLCAIATVVYFINVATVPNNIFGEPIIYEDISRGIVRLPIVFVEMFPLLVFYGINRYLITRRKIWMAVIAWGGLMVILSVTRQIIAATTVLGAWFYFQRVSAARKIALVLALGAIAVVVLPQIPVYQAMVELSEDQRDENELDENIRITAWRWYTYENQDNALTPVIGNGVPSLGISRWGIMAESEADDNGCYVADVGWAGFFWHFGAIATIGLVVLMISGITKRKSKERQYLTYWLIYIFLTSFASGPIIYFNWTLSIMVVLYLVFGTSDTSAAVAEGADSQDTSTAIPSETEPHPLRPRYPQLPQRK